MDVVDYSPAYPQGATIPKPLVWKIVCGTIVYRVSDLTDMYVQTNADIGGLSMAQQMEGCFFIFHYDLKASLFFVPRRIATNGVYYIKPATVTGLAAMPAGI